MSSFFSSIGAFFTSIGGQKVLKVTIFGIVTVGQFILDSFLRKKTPSEQSIDNQKNVYQKEKEIIENIEDNVVLPTIDMMEKNYEN